jgi:hypothetical protein
LAQRKHATKDIHSCKDVETLQRKYVVVVVEVDEEETGDGLKDA